MRLYHVPGTRSSRVRWMLEESGLPYELETITREERHEPAHLARHPLGRVPVIHDGTGYVFESAGHCLQIADLAPEAGLIAAVGTHERFLQYQWVFFAMIEMEVPVVAMYLYGPNSAIGTPKADRAEEGLAAYRKAAQLIEDALAGKEFLVGDSFSVADVVVAGVLGFGQFLGMNEGFTNIAGYLERTHGRPAYARANA
jgi:glutathione S-transferase